MGDHDGGANARAPQRLVRRGVRNPPDAGGEQRVGAHPDEMGRSVGTDAMAPEPPDARLYTLVGEEFLELFFVTAE